MFQTVNKKLLSPWREKNLDATVLCPCLPTLPANSLAAHPEEVDEEKVVVMEKKISSESSSSTGSDGSNKRVFPVLDLEIVLLDKSQHDHAEVMKEHDDSTSSNIEKKEGVKYKKSKSTRTLLRRWSFKGLLRRSSNERGASRSSKNTEEGKEGSFVFSRCFSLSSRSSSKVSTTLEEGEKLRSDGCILHLCPCLSSPPADSIQRPKEADQEK